ncbi:HK97 gp10 family phage protein [Clostridium tyrobutyricum]|uniref:HK97 gp10 family phage protein n=1 Tax=Clostridium tyrobutyricum TaxID=1519 RepID=UPI002B21439F|nr:HK97 gp10 family phage protein [Clostridium tyrobutyricum]MEA5008233.1 HK97 gp10 family phage protein [Clostridium tyrobutyricum]
MGFDIEGLDEFKNAMIDLMKVKFPEELEREIYNLANRIWVKVKKRTPVGVYKNGHSGGDLRKNWQIGNLVREGNGYYIEVFNILDYASHVEYGHRTRLGKTDHPHTYKKRGTIDFVPGKYMLKISVEELNKELPGYLSSWLDNVIKEHGL